MPMCLKFLQRENVYYHELLGLVEERAEHRGPPILEVAVPLETPL